jgi:hypothetical protein
MQLPAEDVLSVPLALIGTEGEMADQLQRQRDEFGFSYRTVPSSAMETFAPIVERLAGT